MRPTVARRPASRKRWSHVASNWMMAEPNWKPWVHSVQPRLVYWPRTLNTGVPHSGLQRRSRRSILEADSSNRRRMAGSRSRGCSEGSLASNSKPPQVEAAVEVDDVARREGKGALHEGADRPAHVVRRPPAALRYQPFGDQAVVPVLHAGGHIGGHDPGPQLEHLDAVRREPCGPELRHHGEAGLRDAVLAAVERGGVGGQRRDEHELVAARQA